MKVYFTNDSKQKKTLIETDYAEDAYDVIIAFFEEHRNFPHFLQLEREENRAKISFGSYTEFFYVESVTDEDYEKIEELIKEYNS